MTEVKPAAVDSKAARARWLIRAAAALALLAPLLVLSGALGSKLGLWSWRFGFGTLTVNWAPKVAMAGLAAAVLAAVLAVALGGKRTLSRSWPLVLVGLLAPVVTLAGFLQLKARAASVPPIHDYATDWTQPVMPSPQLLSARGPDANPIVETPRTKALSSRPEVENWADDRVSRIGSEACPQARPVTLRLSPSQAQARAATALTSAGLEIVTEAPGRIEATHTSFWYGFKDDVMVRIRAEGAGSRVDIRSVSRAGQSDLGANCRRIVALTEALRG